MKRALCWLSGSVNDSSVNSSSDNSNNENTTTGAPRDLTRGTARIGVMTATVAVDVMMIVTLGILLVHLLVMSLAIAMLRDVVQIMSGRVRESSGGGIEDGSYGGRKMERLIY